MKTVNYKGKGEHSVRELELIIEQQAEELHLIKSEQFYCFNEKNKRIDRCENQCGTCKEMKLMQ